MMQRRYLMVPWCWCWRPHASWPCRWRSKAATCEQRRACGQAVCTAASPRTSRCAEHAALAAAASRFGNQ